MSVIISIIIFLWLAVLTVLVFRMISHYNGLSQGITKTGLREVLDAILRTLSKTREKSEETEQSLHGLAEQSSHHIHKIGLVRFNPFADTGGAQSFVIAMLNKGDSGIVMTSLYGRNGNRWYVKEVIAGKGKEMALSKEEESAIREARIIGN